jgi:hypothetical protein
MLLLLLLLLLSPRDVRARNSIKDTYFSPEPYLSMTRSQQPPPSPINLRVRCAVDPNLLHQTGPHAVA